MCHMCDDSDLSVPEDVAVLGFGNEEASCECRDPSLSSIALDDAAQAEPVVHLLDCLMQGKPVGQTTVKIPKLLKIGAVITRNTRRIRIHLSTAYPYQSTFLLVVRRLAIE